MDEFVASLLAPEMRSRSSSAPSRPAASCGRAPAPHSSSPRRQQQPLSFAPAAENTPSSTMFRSSLQHSSAFQHLPPQHQFYGASTAAHARLNAGPEDPDEVFRQLWYEPEPEESLASLHMRLGGGSGSGSLAQNHGHGQTEHLGAKLGSIAYDEEDESEPVIDVPPSSTNSLLFEPLDLPPKSTGSTGSFSLEQTLKDAFLNFTPDTSPPPSVTSLEKMQLQQALAAAASSYARANAASSRMYDPHATPRGLYEQEQQPVMPLRHQHAQHEYQASNVGNNSSTSASIMNAILGIQTAPWMSTLQDTSSNNNNNGNGLSEYAQPPTSMRQLLLSATTPSMNPSAMDANPLWISASMLMTPTSQLPAPELSRKISNKKSKARRPAKAVGRRASSVASALVLSLAGITNNNSSSMSSSARDHHSRSSMSMGSPSASVHSDSENLSTAESSGDKGAKGKKCVEPGCVRRAQSNSRCKAHGGGARCQWTGTGGCARSSQGGGFCRAHGGGKRCEYPGCVRGQQRKGRCYVHGGIRKCQMGDCEKKDRGNGYCISHGGGKRCEHPGCSRAVRRGLLCQLHEIAS